MEGVKTKGEMEFNVERKKTINKKSGATISPLDYISKNEWFDNLREKKEPGNT